MILAGDIGGTNTRLALFAWEDGCLKAAEEATFRSREYSSLDEIVVEFVASRKLPVERAGFGIAGPIKNGRCEATNLAWIIDGHQLARKLALEKVVLVNDLEANAYGIAMLELKDFVVLNQGAADASGNAAIISAGTGLGEAGLFWDGNQHRPFACEGGHTDLAPRNELEMELLRYLLRKFSRVSYERAVSGPGLVNIYDFLRDTGRGQESPRIVEEMRQQNPAAVISKAALDGTCALSVQALDLFVSLYGAEAGNLALKIMSVGGVFIGGGIAPKILPKLVGPLFMEAFTTKGRMSPLLKAMPVRVIMNEKTALLGATRCVLDQL
jgi:glucokinase